MTKSFYDDYANKREKPLKKHRFSSVFWIFVAAIFLCIIFLPLLLSKKKTSVFGKTFFALSVGSTESLVRANDLAGDVSDKGGAGFILPGKLTKVVVFAYKNQNDALSVSKKLDGFETEIVQIKIGKIPSKYRKNTEIVKLERLLSDCIYQMYDVSIDLDKGNMTEGEIVTTVIAIEKEFSKQKQIFMSSEFSGVHEIVQRLHAEAVEFIKVYKEPDKISSRTKHFFLSLIVEAQNISNYLSEC